jgi:hypothetical protein
MLWRSAHPLTNRANSLAEILKSTGGSGIFDRARHKKRGVAAAFSIPVSAPF